MAIPGDRFRSHHELGWLGVGAGYGLKGTWSSAPVFDAWFSIRIRASAE